MNQAQEHFLNDIRQRMFNVYGPYKDREYIIYGAGERGITLLSLLKDIGLGDRVVSFCDGDPSLMGGELEGLPIRDLNELVEIYPNAIYLIASYWLNDIRRKLAEKGAEAVVPDELTRYLEKQAMFIFNERPDDMIIYLWKWMEWYGDLERTGKLDQYMNEMAGILEDDISRQILQERTAFLRTGDVDHIGKIPFSAGLYFNKEYLPIRNDEVYMDCGAYIGDSVTDIVNTVGYKKIISFEPDDTNFARLSNRIRENGWQSIEAVKAAVGEKHETVMLSNSGVDSSSIISWEDEKAIPVRTVKLDDYYDEKPTFIKMDLEGFEMPALRGAEKIIRELKPKIAVSVYHRALDVFEIPKLLKTYNPDYRFRFRHHTHLLYDTVLYAWTDES